MLKSFKYRIYPTEEQKVLLSKHFGCVRWMYNYGLAEKTKAFKEKTKLTHLDIANRITELKNSEETKWLKEVNSQSLQMALRNLDNAYTRFFREKKGFPKFKSKHDNRQSFQCPQRCSVDFNSGVSYIPKFKKGIETVFHRRFDGEIRTVTVSKNPANLYYISILIDDKKESQPLAPIKNAVGIDLGIKEFLILSDGSKIPNPKFSEKGKIKMAFLQKNFSKKVKGSKNREKARLKVAALYNHMSCQRNDFLHKVSRKLVNDNQIDTFCLETLNVKGMMGNHKLARSIGDVSWSSFVTMLEYKSEWAGKNVIKIGRFEPSSKTCSACGSIKEMPLSSRTYECKCGHKEDRDVNAAKNIRDFALLMSKSQKLGEDVASKSVEISKVEGRKTYKLTFKKRQRVVEAEKSCCEIRAPGISSGVVTAEKLNLLKE